MTVSYLEAEDEVVKLEQVVKVQLESDRTHVCETNKQNSISIYMCELFCVLWMFTENTLIFLKIDRQGLSWKPKRSLQAEGLY